MSEVATQPKKTRTRKPKAKTQQEMGGIRAIKHSDLTPSPLNPRKRFDEKALEELASSILEKGILQNLVARPKGEGDGYEIAAGERRYRAVALLIEQLGKHLPEWRYAAPEGGLSLWATLPNPVSSVLATTSERFGVRIAAGVRFGTEGLFERQLRVPFTLPEEQLAEAVARLSRAYLALVSGSKLGSSTSGEWTEPGQGMLV